MERGGNGSGTTDVTRRAREKVRALRETLESDGAAIPSNGGAAPQGVRAPRRAGTGSAAAPGTEETWQTVPAPAQVRDVSAVFYLMGFLLILAAVGIAFGGAQYSSSNGADTFEASIGTVPLWVSLLLVAITLPMAVGAMVLLRRGHPVGVVLAALLAFALVFRGANMFLGVPLAAAASTVPELEEISAVVRQMALVVGLFMLLNATAIIVVLATPLRERLRRGVVRNGRQGAVS